MFSHLTSHLMNRWIKSLEQTHRAKEMYPICMRQVFKAAILEYNDYDNGIIRIKTNPWVKVEIPSADRAEKTCHYTRSVSGILFISSAGK